MCIAIWLISESAHPKYKCILAANRDEFLARPTARASWNNFEGDKILAGRDMAAGGGGIWVGMRQNGQIGILTNFTEPIPSTPPPHSRGDLALKYLTSNPPQSPSQYITSLDPKPQEYAAFNLLLIDLGVPPEVAYLSNRSTTFEPHLVDQGVGGISNSLIGDPWPKVQRGKDCMQSLLEAESNTGGGWSSEDWIDRLSEMMSQEHTIEKREDFILSTTIPPLHLPFKASGVKGTYEESSSWYATRLLTIILVDHDGNFTFVEKDVYELSEGARPRKGVGLRSFQGKLDSRGTG